MGGKGRGKVMATNLLKTNICSFFAKLKKNTMGHCVGGGRDPTSNFTTDPEPKNLDCPASSKLKANRKAKTHTKELFVFKIFKKKKFQVNFK